MKKFKYTGNQSHNSTIVMKKGGKAVTQDLCLHPGEIVDVPEEHPTVKTLIETGLLVEVKQISTNQNPK